jgi:hypothetical protein
MSEDTNHLSSSPDLALVEEALRALGPAATAIRRDRLLFEAGRAAAPKASRLWPGAAILFAALSLALAVLLIFPGDRQPVVVERERIVEVFVPVPAEPRLSQSPSVSSPAAAPEIVQSEPLSPEALRMFQVRRDVLRWGPEMLPASKPVEMPRSPRDSARDLDRWLEVPPGTLTAPYRQTSKPFLNLQGDD